MDAQPASVTQKIRIFFKGAPKKATLETVTAAFRSFGELRFFKMPFSQKNRCFMGYGHLAFVDDKVNEKFKSGEPEVRVEGVLLEVGVHQRKQRSKRCAKQTQAGLFSHPIHTDAKQATQTSEATSRSSETPTTRAPEAAHLRTSKITPQAIGQADLWVQLFRPTQRQYFRARSGYGLLVDTCHQHFNMRFQMSVVSPEQRAAATPSSISIARSREIYSNLCTY